MKRSRRNVVTRRLADGTVKTYVYERGQRTDAVEPKPKTLGDLIVEFKRSAAFKNLAPSTKALRLISIKKLEQLAAEPLSEITYPVVQRIQSHMAETPGMANVTLGLLKRMMRMAVRMGWAASNPLTELEKLKTKEGKPWPWWAIRQFRERADPDWVFVLDLAIACGQAVGDVRRLRWSNYDGKWIRLHRQKSGEAAGSPQSPEMIAQLNARKREAKGLTIITTKTGAPYSKTGFEAAWRKQMVKVGLHGRGFVFHGLRHARATMMADSGASEHAIAGVLGHKSVITTKRYTQNANRERLVEEAFPRFAAEWQNGKTKSGN